MRISDWSSDVCSSDLQLYRPRGNVAALYVADHGSPGVTGGMMTCLETLDAARGAKAAVEIFSLIAVGSGRRRQPFAFNGKQRLIFRSEEHTSELQSLMRISYAVFCLKKTNIMIGTLIDRYAK